MKNTVLQAKEEARRMKEQKMMPVAKFQEGEMVTLTFHDQDALILGSTFNPIPWMFSYKVALETGEVTEVMEWAVTKR